MRSLPLLPVLNLSCIFISYSCSTLGGKNYGASQHSGELVPIIPIPLDDRNHTAGHWVHKSCQGNVTSTNAKFCYNVRFLNAHLPRCIILVS